MTDEEMLLFFLLMVYLLDHNRQLNLYRLFSCSFMLERVRTLELQRVAVQHFFNLYHNRRAWVYHRRDNDFAEYFANEENFQLDPHYWHSNFRMSQETVLFLCDILHDLMVKDSTNIRETIPVPKRIAVALWWLAHGSSYCVVGQNFGVSTSIVCRITKDFVGALVYLRNNYISWPQTPEECSNAVESFRDLSPLPNVFAAMNGTHVQIIAPENSTVDFFDKKQRYSIGCQGVCDSKLKFLAMSAGFPGSLHDSRMLRNTWIFEQATIEQILTAPVYPLSEVDNIKPYIVGDAAYPIANWLMKPFPFSKNMATIHQKFNLAL